MQKIGNPPKRVGLKDMFTEKIVPRDYSSGVSCSNYFFKDENLREENSEDRSQVPPALEFESHGHENKV